MSEADKKENCEKITESCRMECYGFCKQDINGAKRWKAMKNGKAYTFASVNEAQMGFSKKYFEKQPKMQIKNILYRLHLGKSP